MHIALTDAFLTATSLAEPRSRSALSQTMQPLEKHQTVPPSKQYILRAYFGAKQAGLNVGTWCLAIQPQQDFKASQD
jgi:hypothetical protein